MTDRAVLSVDVGGSHVKVLTSGGGQQQRRFVSGSELGPRELAERVVALTSDWAYDAISIGIPAPVRAGRIVSEPVVLGSGLRRRAEPKVVCHRHALRPKLRVTRARVYQKSGVDASSPLR
jgi:predicted NBD/HSP70 family sugar kinase